MDISYKNSEFLKSIRDLQVEVIAPAYGSTNEIRGKLSKEHNINISEVHFDSLASPFHSNTDEIRLNCLKDALNNDNINVIWCLTGGYGSAKLIPGLIEMPKPEKKKFFIGYSDITALHLAISQSFGWQTIHGAVLREIYDESKDPQNFKIIADILLGNCQKIVVDDLESLNEYANKGNINAKITGGNMSIIRTSIGTNWHIQSVNKILFLEDVNEKGYQVDRALYHLLQANIFDKTKAIVFGTFDGNEDELIKYSLKEFAKKISIPVFKSNKFGHQKTNIPIVYNSNATIRPTTDKNTYHLEMVL